MTWTCLDGNDVAFLQLQVVHIMEIALAGMLELHLHQVCGLSISRHICEPVVGVQLAILTAYSRPAQSTVASHSDGQIFCFLCHIYFLFTLFSYFCRSSMIICRAKSKNTIFALAFCPISRMARLARSLMGRIFFSLTKRAKFLAKSSSFWVI